VTMLDVLAAVAVGHVRGNRLGARSHVEANPRHADVAPARGCGAQPSTRVGAQPSPGGTSPPGEGCPLPPLEAQVTLWAEVAWRCLRAHSHKENLDEQQQDST
jgi:hypothetical protein